jgi:uncharacterized protein
MYLWQHQRRFNSYPEYFRKHFGKRVQKLAIDAGFTCPNRDGTKGSGGCTFCDSNSFNPGYCLPEKGISTQLAEGVEFHVKRYRKATKYLAYFQAFSNTYADLDVLKTRYEEALQFPGVIGLTIGTRPDCINDAILEYLSELSEKYYIVVEYGVETTSEEVLRRVNRGHTFAQSLEAIWKTHQKGIKTGAHLMFGFPGETKDYIINQTDAINQLPLHSLKIHQLQMIKGTAMAEDYAQNPDRYHFYSLQEYLDLVIDFLERLKPQILIERIAGEVPPRFQAGPGWGLIRNNQVLHLFEQRLKERSTWQGRLFKNAN